MTRSAHDDRIPGKRVRQNRPTERAAVRAVTAVFEDANMLVQPVDGSIDIGKDLYVDVTEESRATGEVIAVQVKGGESYQRRTGSSFSCTRDDLALWAASTVPIFAVVHDPKSGRLPWINLTSWARSHTSTNSRPRTVELDGAYSLSATTLPQFVAEARDFLRASGAPVLLDLVSDDPTIQQAAVYDAFALGRTDARALLLLRAALRYISDPAPLRLAIHILALCCGHEDIFWSARNWIPSEIRARVVAEMDWSYDELCKLLGAAEPDEYVRGGVGRDVAAIVGTGWAPDVENELIDVARRASIDAAWPALMLLVTQAGDQGLEILDSAVSRSRALAGEPAVAELRSTLLQHGRASMW
ncbi:MAG: DUF4365 domain-containing protein [Gaiellaceae bacterium]